MILPVSLLVMLAFGYLFRADCQNQGAGPVTFYQYEVSDTTKWHPEYFIIVYPDLRITFRFPDEEDRTGVANIFFQRKETGIIHQLDTIKNNRRYYHLLTSGNYDAILLYNNGKYIRYNDIVIDKNIETEVDMTKLSIHPLDSESQHWLTMRSFISIIGEKRVIRKNYTMSSENIIRGYVFGEIGGHREGIALWDTLVRLVIDDNYILVAQPAFDGYFEIDVDEDSDQTIRFNNGSHESEAINLPANCGILLVLRESESIKKNGIGTYLR